MLNPDPSKNLQLAGKHESVFKSMNYITFTKKTSINPITHWIVGDFSKLSTLKLIKNTFEHMVSYCRLLFNLIFYTLEKQINNYLFCFTCFIPPQYSFTIFFI